MEAIRTLEGSSIAHFKTLVFYRMDNGKLRYEITTDGERVLKGKMDYPEESWLVADYKEAWAIREDEELFINTIIEEFGFDNSDAIFSLKIPKRVYRGIRRQLDSVMKYTDAKHYWEGVADVMEMLEKYLPDLVENPSEKYHEYMKRIKLIACGEDEQIKKREDTWCDGNCDRCDWYQWDEENEEDACFAEDKNETREELMDHVIGCVEYDIGTEITEQEGEELKFWAVKLRKSYGI